MTQPADPRFTIVVPAYNAAHTLAETLSSIEAQTDPDWNCIVVDDGSTDDTASVAATFAECDARFTVIRQDNEGVAGAYNSGVSAARSEWIVMCSADDLLLPEHLEHMQAFMRAEPQYDIYTCNGYYLDPDGARSKVIETAADATPSSCTLAEILHWCFYSVGSVYRRTLWEQVGGYRVGVFGEDYDFWLRALASGATQRFNPEALTVHRRSSEQKSANVEQAYLSDIRLITDLERDFQLSDEERKAAREGVAMRRRMIAELHSPALRRLHAARQAVAEAAARVLGEETVHRVARSTRPHTEKSREDE